MSCIPQFPLVGSYMAGALEGLYNHALPIHTPATLLASSTAQGQTYPQVRNTIHCFHFGWEQTTSRDNMSSNIFVSVDQLSNNNKQTQSQNVHISAEFGGRGRMGSSVKTIKERFVLIRNRSPGSVKENRWRRLVHYTDKVSSPSPSPTCPSDNLHASKYSFTKFLGNHL